MKIGYPCINLTIECRGDKSFRLKSYSEQRLKKTINNNLTCLQKILEFNMAHDILFFRFTSDLVPFASHPICKFNWQNHFKTRFVEIGSFIRTHGIRISMHPDQFTLINSLDARVFKNSCRELAYHSEVLDLMQLSESAKTQIHVGGVYGNKEESMKRFIRRFNSLEDSIRRRLVIENDDLLYRLKDCIEISNQTGIPVLFDVFHHTANNGGQTMKEAFAEFMPTWKTKDGLPMVDYSSRAEDGPKRKHAESLDIDHFQRFLHETKSLDFDIMLEIKDKEKSAIKAIAVASKDERLVRAKYVTRAIS